VEAVRKPWGFEYPLIETDEVGLWFLNLDPGASTSLHCHPKKKTGLVVLSGEVEVDFLNSSIKVGPAERVMLRPGLFHRSTASGNKSALMLEIESPRDKDDLVRFEDRYGREFTPYEDVSHNFQLTDPKSIMLDAQKLVVESQAIGEVTATYKNIGCLEDLECFDSDSTILIIRGRMNSGQHSVLTPADVISVATLRRLFEKFEVENSLETIVVSRSSI